MDWLTFIAEIIKALAWPGAIVILVLVLRKPISGLIPLLQKLKYKDLELEFGRAVEEVKEEVRAQLPTAPRALRPGAVGLIAKLAEMSPRAAVIEAWRQVEDASIDAAKRNGIDLPARHVILPAYVLQMLQTKGLLDADKVRIINELRALRNSAAHAPEFALSKESALEYANLATTLVEYLGSL